MPRKNAAQPRPAPGPREERYLHCLTCDMSMILNLGPNEDRPMHRCSVVYKAMPFDVDLPGSKAPKRPIKEWFEEKPKRPRPPTGARRPRIVL